MARSHYGSERSIARGRCIAALAVVVVVALAIAANGRTAEIPVAGEYDIKAAFLVNFSKFVEWPEHGSDVRATPIVIGVLGADPFGSKLDVIAGDRQVDGRPIVIRRFASLDGAVRCHILFVGARSPAELAAILSWAAAQGVLTVGDGPEFTARGGAIEFFVQDQKVRFAINLEAASAAGLKVSSHLARLATTPRNVRNVGGQ
jgi:hypothetical protein